MKKIKKFYRKYDVEILFTVAVGGALGLGYWFATLTHTASTVSDIQGFINTATKEQFLLVTYFDGTHETFLWNDIV